MVMVMVIIVVMSQILDTQQHVRLVFLLLGDNNFNPWGQPMSDQLSAMDL